MSGCPGRRWHPPGDLKGKKLGEGRQHCRQGRAGARSRGDRAQPAQETEGNRCGPVIPEGTGHHYRADWASVLNTAGPTARLLLLLFPRSLLPASQRPSGWQKVWKQILSGPRGPFHLQPRLPAGRAQQRRVSPQWHLDSRAAPLPRYRAPPATQGTPKGCVVRVPDSSHPQLQNGVSIADRSPACCRSLLNPHHDLGLLCV